MAHMESAGDMPYQAAYDKLQAAMDNQSWVYLTPLECRLLMAELAHAQRPSMNGTAQGLAERNGITMQPVK